MDLLNFMDNSLEYWNTLDWKKINPYDKRYWVALVGGLLHRRKPINIVSSEGIKYQGIKEEIELISFLDDISFVTIVTIQNLLYKMSYFLQYYVESDYICYNKDFNQVISQLTSDEFDVAFSLPTLLVNSISYTINLNFTDDLLASILTDFYLKIKNLRYKKFDFSPRVSSVVNYDKELKIKDFHGVVQGYTYEYASTKEGYIKKIEELENLFNDCKNTKEYIEDLYSPPSFLPKTLNCYCLLTTRLFISDYSGRKNVEIYYVCQFPYQYKILFPKAIPLSSYAIIRDDRGKNFPVCQTLHLPQYKPNTWLVAKLQKNSKGDRELDLTFDYTKVKTAKRIVNWDSEIGRPIYTEENLEYLESSSLFFQTIVLDVWEQNKFV